MVVEGQAVLEWYSTRAEVEAEFGGWQVYELRKSSLSKGIIYLALFLAPAANRQETSGKVQT